MTKELMQEAIKSFNEAKQSVANEGDFSPFLLMDKIKTAGGLEALGIDPKEMEALNRRGAVNSASSILKKLETVDVSSSSFAVYGRFLNGAMSRLGTGGHIQLGEEARERLSAYVRKLPPRTPSLCGDQ